MPRDTAPAFDSRSGLEARLDALSDDALLILYARGDAEAARVELTLTAVTGTLPLNACEAAATLTATLLGSSVAWQREFGFEDTLVDASGLPVGGAFGLPGLPPRGPPGACYLQACPGFACVNTSPIVPMPHPCSA